MLAFTQITYTANSRRGYDIDFITARRRSIVIRYKVAVVVLLYFTRFITDRGELIVYAPMYLIIGIEYTLQRGHPYRYARNSGLFSVMYVTPQYE